jgi:DNA-binding MarR family transcriptional regulator
LAKAVDSELRKNVGITFGQWKVLVILTRIQDGLTQKEIADQLGLEAPTLIPIIDKLESDGFVERRVDQNDRRNNRIYRTQKVDTVWDNTINCAIRILKLALANIPETRVIIMQEVLEKMWINLRLNFDNIDVNSSTATVKAAASPPSPISNTKVSSLVAATASDTAKPEIAGKKAKASKGEYKS